MSINSAAKLISALPSLLMLFTPRRPTQRSFLNCGRGRPAGRRAARFLRTSASSALCQETFDRQWPRAAQDEGRKTREVKEIGFITRRSELRAGSRHRLELD